MKTTSPMTKALMVAGVAAAMLTALAGCAADAAGSTPAPTTTVTATVTATPGPTVVSPDDPVDALTAWNACAVLSQAEYQPTAVSEMRPYDPAHPPTKNPDGSWQVIVGYPIVPEVEGAKSNIMICDIAGTLGAPKLVHWTMKDI
jgi:hypothetical protein